MSKMLDFNDAAAKALEAMYLTPDVVAQRARVLDLLAPRPGEKIIDIGVGPGLLAEDLARLVGDTGRVTGLDMAEPMVKMARTRLAALPQAECVVGEATALDFPDGTFDAAVSTQVYEYVAGMPKAMRELHRILKPGGRALILDTDWRSVVWHSSDEARMARILAAGRHRDAGFRNDEAAARRRVGRRAAVGRRDRDAVAQLATVHRHDLPHGACDHLALLDEIRLHRLLDVLRDVREPFLEPPYAAIIGHCSPRTAGRKSNRGIRL